MREIRLPDPIPKFPLHNFLNEAASKSDYVSVAIE
jgi:hypothetical protein